MNAESEHRVMFTHAEIASAVKKLASQISRDYHDKHPILLGILKGSFIFMADLVRLLDFPLEIDFIRLSSYCSGMETTGKINVIHQLCCRIEGRHVIVVEDIVDSGLTIAFLLGYLAERKPASVKLCSLLDKPSRRKVPVTIDYLGFSIPNKFIVGYGIDWDEKFRYLPDIRFIEEGTK